MYGVLDGLCEIQITIALPKAKKRNTKSRNKNFSVIHASDFSLVHYAIFVFQLKVSTPPVILRYFILKQKPLHA